MNDKNTSQGSSRNAFDDICKVIEQAFIGFMGASMLGMEFGIWPLLITGLIGSSCMGYWSYKSIYKDPSGTETKEKS
ncbi:hypothetical protein [Pedobacter sp. FW305-3-2-15-E-R2A2]|jgi:hypothetical protein|uniref:hypothetical protein n=1 Tax=Pedobacter sp. FW305-3-2-15-E-R2A2 TaxID=3140251 RepID=UPI00313FF821